MIIPTKDLMSDARQAQWESLLGAVLEGKYRVKRLIGSGGMGRVFEAEHVGIKRRVAIKVLHASVASDPEIRERFRREALICGSLGHENIIQVTDTGTTPEDTPFIVMEFLEGRRLEEVLAAEGPLPLARALAIMVPLLNALSAVHKAGVIHRDLKPENVFLMRRSGSDDPDDLVVKVLDFGISKPIGPDFDMKTLTREGSVLGTPFYMPPEQLRAQSIDHRVDIYSAGILLYELLTGRTPFNGETFGALFSSILVDEPPSLTQLRPDLPPELELVVFRAIARKPEMRYGSAGELLEALRPFSSWQAGSSPAIAPPADDTGERSSSYVDTVIVDSLSETLVKKNVSASASASASATPSSTGHRRLVLLIAICAVICFVLGLGGMLLFHDLFGAP